MSRSSNLKRQHESDETFTRAAWETHKDTELAYGVRILWSVSPDAQRGVWRVMAVAWHMEGDSPVRAIARASGDFPNSRAGSLSAYLFTIVNTIAMQVDSVREAEERARN